MFDTFKALLARYQASDNVPSRQGRRTYPPRVSACRPASAADLKQSETWLGNDLPQDDRAVLQRCDGASLFALTPGHHPSLFAATAVPSAQFPFEGSPSGRKSASRTMKASSSWIARLVSTGLAVPLGGRVSARWMTCSATRLWHRACGVCRCIHRRGREMVLVLAAELYAQHSAGLRR